MFHSPCPPADEQRCTVRVLAGFGVPHDDICLMVKCSPPTLRNWFRHELNVTTNEASACAAQTLFQQATTPGIIATNTFWLKARAGWREKQIAPADGPGAAAQVVVIRCMFNPIGGDRHASELLPPLIEGDVHDPDR